MSSLWTPGGEHHVPRPGGGAAPPAGGGAAPPAGGGPGRPPRPAPADADEGFDTEALTPEQEAAMAEAAGEISEIRAQLAAAPPELVVANHVMGLYELAAIHLNREQPDLEAARLAIDALSGVIDACKGRLGEPEATLVDARHQLQLAYVQVVSWVREQAAQ
jgi:hypothetical protein